MNKRDTKKLAALVAKSASQKEAVLSYMSEGNTITSDGAKAAGIGDPRRVVNRLRDAGHRINGDSAIGRTVYALAPAKKRTKR